MSRQNQPGQCVECGECLANCRYMNLSRRQAVQEIRKINQGKKTRVLSRCASCFACDAFCPRDARPYERILAYWDKRYRAKGLPRRARFLLPHARPNFRQDLPYGPAESRLHEKWAAPDPPAKKVLYPGCNFLALPHLGTGPLFEDLPVWGAWDLCCGEMYFRMGLFDVVDRVARRLTRFYADKGLEEMVFTCPACYNMFTNVLPRQFGAEFSFRTTFFTDWFFEKLDHGEITITAPLDQDVVIHDSCHARVLGDEFMDSQRRLLKTVGCHVYETRRNRKQGLCCGMAAGCNRYSGPDMIRATLRQLYALSRSPAPTAAIYCTGCLLTLNLARGTVPFGPDCVHSLELVHRAMNWKIPPKSRDRGRDILRAVSGHAAKTYLSFKRFYASDMIDD